MLFTNTVRSSLTHTVRPDVVLQDLVSSAPSRIRVNCLSIQSHISNTRTQYQCPSLPPGLRERGFIRLHSPPVIGHSVSMKTEIMLIGLSRMASFISANSVHCLGYAGRRYITTRPSTSFETKRSFLGNRNLCPWGQRRCLVKCMRSSAVRVLQGRKSMLSVSTTPCDYQTFALIGDSVCLVGGSDRPIPQPKEAASTSPTDRANTPKDSIASGTSDLYNRLGNAMSERGQMLDGLEDTVNSLRTGSENMLAQVCPISS